METISRRGLIVEAVGPQPVRFEPKPDRGADFVAVSVSNDGVASETRILSTLKEKAALSPGEELPRDWAACYHCVEAIGVDNEHPFERFADCFLAKNGQAKCHVPNLTPVRAQVIDAEEPSVGFEKDEGGVPAQEGPAKGGSDDSRGVRVSLQSWRAAPPPLHQRRYDSRSQSTPYKPLKLVIPSPPPKSRHN